MVLSELAFACFGALAGAGLVPPDAGDAPASTGPLEAVVFHDVLDTSGAPVDTTILRIPLWITGEPVSRNRSPQVEAFEAESTAFDVDGQVAVSLRVNVDSLDPYTDPLGESVVEEPIATWYASHGRFDSERTAGSEVENVWKYERIEEVPDVVEVFAVVRDGRGGQAVAGPIALRPRDP